MVTTLVSCVKWPRVHTTILYGFFFPFFFYITLFKSITTLCGLDLIPQNIPHAQTEYEEYPETFHGIPLVPHNTVTDVNNVT
jgi:hypothetical protein